MEKKKTNFSRLNFPNRKDIEKYMMTEIDWFILKKIIQNSDSGTIKLAAKVGIAPKNLIARLNRYEGLGWITKETKPVKPKGRKRIFKVTNFGQLLLDGFEDQRKLEKKSKRRMEKIKIKRKIGVKVLAASTLGLHKIQGT